MLLTRLGGCATFLFLLHASAVAENWSQWRGPDRNAVSSEVDLPTQWSAQTGVRWRVRLSGVGVSSPIVWNDRIFLTSAEEVAQDELLLQCLDRESGQLQWRLRLWGTSPTLHHATKSDMATPTPVTDGERVYALFGTGDVFCTDVRGALLWQRSLAQEYGPFENRFGHTSSPLLADDLLILQCDHYGESYLLAIDKSTGENRWKLDRPGIWHSWSSPQLVVDKNGRSLLVVCAAQRMDAFEPATGRAVWSVTGLQRECIPTPVTGHGLIYSVSGPQGAVLAVRPEGHGDITETNVAWRFARGTPYVPSPVLLNDRYYVVDDKGIATCLDAHTGRQLWRQRLGGSFTASPIAGDGKIYMTNDDGETFVIDGGANTYREIARNRLETPVYASVVVAGGCLLFRTPDHLLSIATP